MLENFYDALLANDDKLFSDEDFSKAIVFANKLDIFGVDLDKINLDVHNNFYENVIGSLGLLFPRIIISSDYYSCQTFDLV